MTKNIQSKYAAISLILLIIVVLLSIYDNRYYKKFAYIGDSSSLANSDNSSINNKPALITDSSKLTKTVILPTFNTPIVPGKNNIWCSTFQLAWNEMKDKVINEPIKVEGEELLCERLNNSKQKKTDLMEESYFVAAGKKSEGIVEQIQKGMKSKFPSVEVPKFDDYGDDSNSIEVLLAYSYLEAYLKFRKPYRQNEEALLFQSSSGESTSVKSFGIWEGYRPEFEHISGQLQILYCNINENYQMIECALDLCAFTQPYQIVVALTEPNETLEKTYNSLQEKINGPRNQSSNQNPYWFDSIDILMVPEMFWDITHHFSELEDKTLLNQAYPRWPIKKAIQKINFRLDRSGAIIKSQAEFGIPAAVPKCFIFSKPFLLYIKSRTSDQPFFVMWVDNAELLTPF